MCMAMCIKTGLSREGGWQSVSKRGSLIGSSQGKEGCLGKVYQKEELDWVKSREGGLFGQSVSKRGS